MVPMVAVDATSDFQQLLLGAYSSKGDAQELEKSFKAAQLLRSLAVKTDFTRAANEIAHDITALKGYLRENQHAYAQSGQMSEAARDRLEGEVGAIVRACATNIAWLQELVERGSGADDRDRATPDVVAHRAGAVLALSERLGAATAAYDRLRGLRAETERQVAAQRARRQPRPGWEIDAQARRAEREAAAGTGARPGAAASPQRPGSMRGALQELASRTHLRLAPTKGAGLQGTGTLDVSVHPEGRDAGVGTEKASSLGPGARSRGTGLLAPPAAGLRRRPGAETPTAAALGGPTVESQAAASDKGQNTGQQQQLGYAADDSTALLTELVEMSGAVAQAEASVREVAALNQAFSAAVARQTDAVEMLYANAVKATGHIGAANVQLDKTVKTNRGAQRHMLFFLLVATIGLMFMDWWHS